MDKPASRGLSVQAIVLFEVLWAFAALMFFLLFGPQGVNATPTSDGFWYWLYGLGTGLFEIGAFAIASLLCFRNAFSNQVVSGRKVWLGIGIGMLCYAIGGILFTYWETVLGRTADISPGDLFYLVTYISLGYGMVTAVLDRRLNLDPGQWFIVVAIGAIGVAAGVLISIKADNAEKQAMAFRGWDLTPPAIAATAPASSDVSGQPLLAQATTTKPSPAVSAKPQKATPKTAVTSSPTSSPAPKPSSPPVATPTPSVAPSEAAEPEVPAPAWVLTVEQFLGQFKKPINSFYIIADVFLLIIATTLLLAFWGGRFSLSWRMIAFAAFWLYVADMWFRYNSADPNYKSGSLPEVGWVFSGVLFGLGAALEYDLSRSRRGARKRG